MRLTTRGRAAVAAVVVAVVFGWTFGQPGLNAVAAPLLAALSLAVLAIRWADPPTAHYASLRSGQSGDTRTVILDVDGSGIADIAGPLPPGLGGAEVGGIVTLPHQFERTVPLDERGIYELDRPTVVQRDVFGLVERRADVTTDASVIVYPQVYDLGDPTVGGLFEKAAVAERQEFGRLREYTPGDPLRNVHWKSSAKRDEFMVVEYDLANQHGKVTVVAGTEGRYGDEMAAAAATITLSALDAGLAVELHVPDHHSYYDRGADQERVLRMLAEADAGPVPDRLRERADVLILAGIRGTTIRIPEGHRRFDSLVAGRQRGVGA